MDSSAELLAAFRDIETERGIDREVLFEAIESSLLTACKKNFGSSQNVKVTMDRETGKVQVYAQKTVVNTPEDTMLEISLDDAREHNPAYQLGDIVDIIITPRNFGRISAQSAKQVVIQKIREAERDLQFREYKEKEREVMTGIVQRYDKRSLVVSLGKMEALMPPGEQVPTERYIFGERLKVYVLDVKDTSKGPVVNVSRTHPELVKRLFENEVPEIYDGTVEIKSISREAGSRTKIAVRSKNPNVEAIGACVGQNGYRVNVVVRELRGEKIDIINWSDEPHQFISAALNPSKTLAVVIDEENRSAKIVVPDYQLSLAIGKEGQNARLAAKLTGYKIDIKSDSQSRATGFVDLEDYFKEGEPESFKKQAQEVQEQEEQIVTVEEEQVQAGEAVLPETAAEQTAETPVAVPAQEYYDDEYYDDYDDEYDEYDDDDDDEYYDDDDEYDDDDDDEYYDDDDYDDEQNGAEGQA
jgi:N utilization substance protein A